MDIALSRRGFLARRTFLAGGLSATALAALPRLAQARPEDVDYAILQDYGKISPQDGRITLDLPAHSDAGTSIPLTVTVDSPMTEADYPAVLGLYASGNPRPRIATVAFSPLMGLAQLSTRIRLNSAQDVVGVARMSGGDYWQARQRVTVAFGACNTAGESDKLPPGWQPQTKIAVPKATALGEIVTVRTVITLPMETGLRLDAHNTYLPLWIIHRFICRLDGVEVINVKLEPAIATNPYLAFPVRAVASGVLEFEWQDSKGSVYTRTAALSAGG